MKERMKEGFEERKGRKESGRMEQERKGRNIRKERKEGRKE